jgi:nucleotide-binding universal stress UspA family protein
MVAYLNRPDGEAALALGFRLAKKLDARLLVVHAVQAVSQHARREEVISTIQRLQDLKVPAGMESVEFETREAVTQRPVADELIALAREEGVELLICGTRMRTPVGKALLGSVSQDLILGAPCPVIATRDHYTHA